jgi:ATP-dependent DNA helicase RecG
MKSSLGKLHKILKLEAERGYDNHAVVGGLERMLDFWEGEARADELPEDLLQAVIIRMRDYAKLAPKSRAEALEGLWKRLQRTYPDLPGLPALAQAAVSTVNQAEASQSAAPQPPDRLSEKESGAENAGTTSQRTSRRPKPASQPGKGTAPNEPAALNASVDVLTGVGPRHAQTLSKLGIYTLRDMLYHFPRRYDDYTQMKPINRLKYGEIVTVIGTVQSLASRKLKSGKLNIVEAIVSDGTAAIRITWFNPWIARQLSQGEQIVLSGKTDQYLGRMTMNNPEWEPLDSQQLNTNRIVPVYPLTAQISQRWLRGQMNDVVTYWAARVQDPLSEELRRSADLVDLPTALLQIHFPDSWESLKKAQQRLAFDEIFLLQMGVLHQKKTWQARSGRIFPVEDHWLETQISSLPFTLTGSQQKAIQDIRSDLSSGHPMNRLIQGDVGSGKTVVAALAIAMVSRQGSQAALMAPTSILAEQHYKSLLKILAGIGSDLPEASSTELATTVVMQSHQIRLMVGATPEAEKNEIRQGLADGTIKLVIGTHALIEEPVSFADLQFVVVDEQHRFGVEQRAMLRSKGDNPHLMVMTATPIPRSLALTVYGDLDLSIMDEMPPGRQPVSTHVLMPRERERAYTLIRRQVEQGRQAFIIYPLVEESETSDAKAAVEEHALLQQEIFPRLKLGLLHGRMRPDEKDETMKRFRDGEFHILVSTTVIEVGVDVPNATVMLIEGANRFGLAQLHQLRGRVGRGSEKSYCLLVPETPDQTENERLQVMCETNDGFVLAERDLEQRGPGQFLGTRQAGYAEFQLADLTDVHLIEKARQHARVLFEQDPELAQEEHQLLAAALKYAWGGGRGDIS